MRRGGEQIYRGIAVPLILETWTLAPATCNILDVEFGSDCMIAALQLAKRELSLYGRGQ